MARRTISTFMVAGRDDAWTVTRDGLFYGEYQSRRQADASAQLGARAVEARGGSACILIQPHARPLTH